MGELVDQPLEQILQTPEVKNVFETSSSARRCQPRRC